MTGRCCAKTRDGGQCSKRAKDTVAIGRTLIQVCLSHGSLYRELAFFESGRVAEQRITRGIDLNKKETLIHG